MENRHGCAGLFETNARRLLRAYADAMAMAEPVDLASSPSSASSAEAADLVACMRKGLIKQWLAGPVEKEREMLDRVSCDDTEIFHRKLIQQFALLCRHFGQSLPSLCELILVDDAD
ncbi:MAG: hypothetical protein NBV65_12275 [Burkholderiaceae bacterium]|nr:hypothetical protein [Burkholderiaceae bacterium]